MFSSQKPKLVPVEVPWRISTSGESLVVHLSEDRSVFPTRVDFVGFFAPNEKTSKAPRAAARAALSRPAFQEVAPPATAPYHLVRLTFGHGDWAKLSPSISETETVNSDDYDWSLVNIERLPGEKVDQFLARSRKLWEKTGVCPDPGMYEVQGSPWLERAGLAAQPQWKHYLLLGTDGSVEILAQGWEWRLGPAVPGW